MKSVRVLALIAALALVVVLPSDAASRSRRRKPVRRAPQPAVITPAFLRGKVLFARENSLWIVDPTTRREHLLLKNPFKWEPWIPYSTGIAVSPDLKNIVLEHRPVVKGRKFTGSELWLVHLSTKSVKRLTDTDAMQYATEPRFSPDGRQIVYTRRSGDRWGGPGFTSMEIRLMDSNGTNDRSVIDKHKGQYSIAFWSRDAKRLLFTHYTGSIDYDGDKRELQTCAIDGTDVQPFDGNYGAFLRPDVSPDGLLQVSLAPGGIMFSLRASNTESTKATRYVGRFNELAKNNPQWSRDGRHIIFDSLQTHIDADKDGRPNQKRWQDIWSLGKDGVNLRRIATNARLISVLH